MLLAEWIACQKPVVKRCDMNEQELNKKLAEWAGFSIWAEWDTGFQLFRTPQKPSPDGVHYDSEEFEKNYYDPISTDYFTQSLDACFKWLVPKLKGYSLAKPTYTGVNIFMAYYEDNAYEGVDPIASYALSLAIEKLIDSEVK